MSKTCITIDVSKGKSQVQGFLELDKPLGRSITINHTFDGYKRINQIRDAIIDKAGIEPLVVFEFTGIYHKALEKYLKSMNFKYHIVSPLLAAKERKSELRSKKTDTRDCLSLAKMFFSSNLGEFYNEPEINSILRKYHRAYVTNQTHLVKLKVNFNEALDIIFPNYTSIFSDLYSTNSLKLLKDYKHPDNIKSKSVEDLAKYLQDTSKHSYKWSLNRAKTLMDYVNANLSGCDSDDPLIDFLMDYIFQMEYYIQKCRELMDKMIELAITLPDFVLIRSIPGIADVLATRFLAEIGDMNRFQNFHSLIAYSGTDPIILQSGQISCEHLHISRKGNHRLRAVLFLMVNSMIRNICEDNTIRDFYKKKRTQPLKQLKPKVASIACANKLLRVIYQLHKTGCAYEYAIA